MKWNRDEESPDIEDRRGEGGGGGGGGGFGFGGLHIGAGGFLVLLVLSLLFKRNFFALLSPQGSTNAPRARTGDRPVPGTVDPKQDELTHFVAFVLNDVQATWTKEFQAQGKTYPHAKLVLFRDGIRSGCGFAETASGPFYCPEDHKVYIDLGFYDELRSRFGAPGQFAEAYVLAHEIGHHVQTLTGIEAKVRQAQEDHPGSRNALSVRLELQADCLAGVWAHSTEERGILESGDVESGLGAAAAVGDDRLQKMSTGHVSPETFTHGSSRDRVEWFKRGMSSGRIDGCNTFGSR